MWQKLEDLLLWVPKKIWEWLLDKLAAALEAIPVPSFFADAKSAIANIPPEVGFFLDAFNIGTGLTMIITAYTIRFAIRRIPVIG